MTGRYIARLELSLSGVDTSAAATTYSDGTFELTIISPGVPISSPQFSLGQAIQLRDFLNRHIDGLALPQSGSLAVRSSDDPGQLAAVEELPRTVAHEGCGNWYSSGPQNVKCGTYSDITDAFPNLCPACRSAK